MHQVGLAEADAAVDEQRVVGLAGISRDLHRGRLGELIALALDEGVEGEVRIDAAAEHRCRPRIGARRLGADSDAPFSGSTGGAMPARVPTSSTTSGTTPSAKRPNQFLDPRQGVGAEPIDDITIRRQQAQLPVALDRLQRPNPGIELLLREFALEHAQTAIP
jgi:hypothetical protein